MKSRDSKNILLFALLITFTIFYSCIKENQNPVIISDQLEGTWELETSFNGTTGQSKEYSKGNGNMLTFTNSNYKIYSSGTLMKSGTFQIVKEESVLTKEIVDKIVYDQEINSIKIYIKIENNRLIYAVDAFDGPSSIYQRK